MTCELEGAPKRVARRYRREIFLAGAIYMALVIGGALAIRSFDPPQWARIVLALLPLAPVLLILRAIQVFVSSVDEFQRRVHLEAVMISSGVVALATFAYGFLEEWAGLPHLSLIWVLPALIGVWGAASWVLRRRYQ